MRKQHQLGIKPGNFQLPGQCPNQSLGYLKCKNIKHKEQYGIIGISKNTLNTEFIILVDSCFYICTLLKA